MDLHSHLAKYHDASLFREYADAMEGSGLSVDNMRKGFSQLTYLCMGVATPFTVRPRLPDKFAVTVELRRIIRGNKLLVMRITDVLLGHMWNERDMETLEHLMITRRIALVYRMRDGDEAREEEQRLLQLESVLARKLQGIDENA